LIEFKFVLIAGNK